jgi:DNA-binding NtrC family response regulator
VAVEALQSGAKDYIEIGSPHALTRAITKTKALLASRQRQQNILLPSYLLLSEITAQCTASIKLVAEARALAASPNPIKILCGPSGSGLSTLAHALRLAASKPWLCEEIDLRFFDRDFSALLPGTNKHAWRSTLGQNAYFICDKAEETENDELLDLVQKQRGRIWPAAGGSTVNCAAPYPGLIVITSSPKIAKSWQSLAKAEVLKVPGLEERRDDIPTLCQNFARQAAEWGGTNYKALRNEIVEKFYNHSWPGNLRQLRSAVFNWQAFASSQAQEQALEQALEISESPQAAEAHICAISAAEAAKVVEQAGGVWHMAAARIGLSVQALKSLVQGKDL